MGQMEQGNIGMDPNGEHEVSPQDNFIPGSSPDETFKGETKMSGEYEIEQGTGRIVTKEEKEFNKHFANGNEGFREQA